MKDNKAYLESKHIPQLLQSILAALTVDQPEDHLGYIREKIEQVKEIGSENVNLLTFIKDKHPLENPVRHQFIQPTDNVEEWFPFKVTREKLEGNAYNTEFFELTEPEDTNTHN